MSRRLLFSLTLVAVCIGCKKPPKEEPVDAVVLGGGVLRAPTTLAAATTTTPERPEQPISMLIADRLGVGGGFVIGAKKELLSNDPKNLEGVIAASNRAKHQAVRADAVVPGQSGDLNSDGYVTVDEVVALRQANLSDNEIIDRLKMTKHVFELTDFQEDFLRARRVSDVVIRAIRYTI